MCRLHLPHGYLGLSSAESGSSKKRIIKSYLRKKTITNKYKQGFTYKQTKSNL